MLLPYVVVVALPYAVTEPPGPYAVALPVVYEVLVVGVVNGTLEVVEPVYCGINTRTKLNWPNEFGHINRAL